MIRAARRFDWSRLRARSVAVILMVLIPLFPTMAADDYRVVVSNEKSNALTILDGQTLEVIDVVPTCARPRGLLLHDDGARFFVACADDDRVLIYETSTLSVIGSISGVNEPTTFDLSADGETLYVANEDAATLSIINIAAAKITATVALGLEPEGVKVAADGLVFVASEGSSVVHAVDPLSAAIKANILVRTRPRRFDLSPDGRELWVSVELAGGIDVIDTRTLEVIDEIEFSPSGFRRSEVTPVEIKMAANGRRAYVALGRANRVAVVDVASRDVEKYILVGHRPWGLALNRDETRLFVANGLSDDITVIDTKSLKAVKSIAVGSVPYAILIYD